MYKFNATYEIDREVNKEIMTSCKPTEPLVNPTKKIGIITKNTTVDEKRYQ